MTSTPSPAAPENPEEMMEAGESFNQFLHETTRMLREALRNARNACPDLLEPDTDLALDKRDVPYTTRKLIERHYSTNTHD